MWEPTKSVLKATRLVLHDIPAACSEAVTFRNMSLQHQHESHTQGPGSAHRRRRTINNLSHSEFSIRFLVSEFDNATWAALKHLGPQLSQGILCVEPKVTEDTPESFNGHYDHVLNSCWKAREELFPAIHKAYLSPNVGPLRLTSSTTDIVDTLHSSLRGVMNYLIMSNDTLPGRFPDREEIKRKGVIKRQLK